MSIICDLSKPHPIIYHREICDKALILLCIRCFLFEYLFCSCHDALFLKLARSEVYNCSGKDWKVLCRIISREGKLIFANIKLTPVPTLLSY